jgi:hypothetical protein
MHARALTTLVALTLGITLAATSPALADDVDPQAPVVVNDSISLYPGQEGRIDVLANDTDPAGDDLALCRVPGLDLFENGHFPKVLVLDESIFGGPVGTLALQAMPGARGTHAVDYYVCNHTRLTPATLTVTIRPVQPVDVAKVPGRPGRLQVTNHNDRAITFMPAPPGPCLFGTMGRVGAGQTRTFRVNQHTIRWTAQIGRGGIADHGTVRHIKLNHPTVGPSGSCHMTTIPIKTPHR